MPLGVRATVGEFLYDGDRWILLLCPSESGSVHHIDQVSMAICLHELPKFTFDGGKHITTAVTLA